MEKRIFVFLIMFLLLMQYSFCSSCEKVAELPEAFGILLPDHEKLKQIHINNYFFIEPSKSSKLIIPIKQKSILK